MNKKYFVEETIYSYDGRGEELAGPVTYFVTENPVYHQADPKLRYYDLGELEIDFLSIGEVQDLVDQFDFPEHEQHEQDGYHTTAHGYRVVELPVSQTGEIQKLLFEYDKLRFYFGAIRTN